MEQSFLCPAANQRCCTRADANDLPHEESVSALYDRLESKIYELTATVPVPHMKTVTREKLQYYRDTVKDKAIALIPEVQDLMNQFDYREKDEVKAALAWGFGEGFIKEAYEWFDKLEEVYQEVRLKEVIIVDKAWSSVELFSENDERCVYKFIKQVDPLRTLMETEAYTVLTEELLTKEVKTRPMRQAVFDGPQKGCQ